MQKVFTIWPNAAELAREIGEKPVTVRAWRNRGSIPADRDRVIIEAARSRGIDLRYEDLADARRRSCEARKAERVHPQAEGEGSA